MLHQATNRIFTWLEHRREPFPDVQAEMPPGEFIPFVIHYVRPFWKLLVASSQVAAPVALLEV